MSNYFNVLTLCAPTVGLNICAGWFLCWIISAAVGAICNPESCRNSCKLPWRCPAEVCRCGRCQHQVPLSDMVQGQRGSFRFSDMNLAKIYFNEACVSSCLTVTFITDMDVQKCLFFCCCCVQLNGTNKAQGIIRIGTNNQPNKYPTFKRPAEFGEKYSLLLHNVRHEDSGSYQCSISANVGSQNQDFTVNLIVNGEL